MQAILQRCSFFPHEFDVTQRKNSFLLVFIFERGTMSESKTKMSVVKVLDRDLNLQRTNADQRDTEPLKAKVSETLRFILAR